MARKFKCRNGTILEECKEGIFSHKCLYDPTGLWRKESLHRLLTGIPYTTGGDWGSGYDIVEELLPKKKRKAKIPTATNVRLVELTLGDTTTKWFEYAKDKKLELLLDVIKALDLTYEATASVQWGITERTITIHI